MELRQGRVAERELSDEGGLDEPSLAQLFEEKQKNLIEATERLEMTERGEGEEMTLLEVRVKECEGWGGERGGPGRGGVREVGPQVEASVELNTVMESETAIWRSHVDEMLLVGDHQRVWGGRRREREGGLESLQGIGDDLLCPGHHGLIVAIGLVQFNCCELRVVSRGQTFVPEDSACEGRRGRGGEERRGGRGGSGKVKRHQDHLRVWPIS
jgi:hypothetical protein